MGPFGSAKSVHSFLRAAASLWFIALREFQIPWTNFFDDFPTLRPVGEESPITSCVQMFFKLPEGKVAEDGPKALPSRPCSKPWEYR